MQHVDVEVFFSLARLCLLCIEKKRGELEYLPPHNHINQKHAHGAESGIFFTSNFTARFCG
jgi:hypothetical protein